MRNDPVLLRDYNEIITDLCGILSNLFLQHVVYYNHSNEDRGFFYMIFNQIFPLSEKLVDHTIANHEIEELIGLLQVLRAKQAAFFLNRYDKQDRNDSMDFSLVYLDFFSDKVATILLNSLGDYYSAKQCVENCSLFGGDFSNSNYLDKDDVRQLYLLLDKSSDFKKIYDGLDVSLESDDPVLSQMISRFNSLNQIIQHFIEVPDAFIFPESDFFKTMLSSSPINKEKFASVFPMLSALLEKIGADAESSSKDDGDMMIKSLVRLYLSQLKLISCHDPLLQISIVCDEMSVFLKLSAVKSADPDHLFLQLVGDVQKELSAAQDGPLKNLCVTPVGLEAVFSATYQSRGAIQSKHRIAVNLILRHFTQRFLDSITADSMRAGECLISSLLMLLPIYANRFNGPILPDQFNFNEGLAGGFLVPYYPIGDDFTHTEFYIVDYLFGQQRALTNMLATASMFLTDQPCDITIVEFVIRANQYFNLDLEIVSPDLKSVDPLVASIAIGEGVAIHQICYFFRSNKCCYSEELVSLYTALLNKIFNTANDKKTRVNAIFCLVFLFGSNPVLYRGTGGAFLTDMLMVSLLYHIGEKPIRKNFLNITEIELLLCFSKDDAASWEKPYQLYEAACRGETNALFHPVEAGIVPLLATLPTADKMTSCWPDYVGWRLVLIFKIALSIEETDLSFQALTNLPVGAIKQNIEHFSSANQMPSFSAWLAEKETVSLRELICFVRDHELDLGFTSADLQASWMTLAKRDQSVETVGNQFLSSVLQLYQERINESILLQSRVTPGGSHGFFSRVDQTGVQAASAAAAKEDVGGFKRN